MTNYASSGAEDLIARINERFGHIRQAGSSIGYAAIVEHGVDYVYFRPLSLNDIPGAEPVEPNAVLAFSVGRALGAAGYVPNPEMPLTMDVLMEVLRSGGRLPLKLRGPLRNPDGSEIDTPCVGCFWCDCVNGSCGCY